MTIPIQTHNHWRSSDSLGRDALLRSLGDRMATEKRLVIGTDPHLKHSTGVGQTHLISKLIRDHIPGGSASIVLSGSTPQAWHASLLRAAQHLPTRQTRFRRIADVIGALRTWLRDHRDWVLVADSLPGLREIEELAAGIDTGRVIVILRQREKDKFPSWPAPVPLGSLSSEDALTLLSRSASREWHNTSEVIAATQIVTLLERNPRSLTLAGRTMKLSGMGPQDFIHALKALQRESLQQSCLSVLVRTIQQCHPSAMQLLAALVACGPAPLPASLASHIAGQGTTSSGGIRILIEAGLLEESQDASQYRVAASTDLMKILSPEELADGAILAGSALPARPIRDRLHQHVCGDNDETSDLDPLAEQRVSLGLILSGKSALDEREAALVRQGADAALDLLLPEIAQKLQLRVLSQSMLASNRQEALRQPLIECGIALLAGEQSALARRRWRQALDFTPPDHPAHAELLLAVAEIDVNENRFDRALGRLVSATEIIRKQPSSAHSQLLEGARKYLKAGVFLGRGEARTARDLFQAALDLRSPLLPVDHLHLMRNRLMLARAEFLLKNLDSSEQLLRNEIAIREQSPHVSDTEVAVACNFLAEQYYLTGRLSDAEPLCERTLELRRATLPAGHRLIGDVTNRLAVIKSARGAYKESDALFRESLTIVEQTFGCEHPEVARVLNDLAESLFAQNKVEPARRLLEKALHIQELSLKPSDTRLSRTRCNLASVYVTRGRFPEAVRLYERDIAERQSQQAPDKALLATSLNNLAEALRSLGRIGEAEERLGQALTLREQLVGPDHPQVAQVLNNLGYLHLQQHRYTEACECLQRALRIREACLSPQHPHLASTLGTLAEIQFAQGRYEEARPLYQRAIEISLNAFGERHPQVASLQICSARNELRLGHVGRAELMLLRGKTTIEEVLGANHRMSSRVLLSLSELAHAEQRYEPAFPMLERCLAIQLGTMSPQRLEIAETLQLITENLVARGLFAEALPRITEAIDIQQRMLGVNHPELIPTQLQLAKIHQQLGHAAEAELAYGFVLEHADTSLHSQFISIASEKLPDVLVEQQKYEEAADCLTRNIEAIEVLGISPTLLNLCSQLAGIHYLRNQPAEAAPWMERSVVLSEQIHGVDSPETAKHLDNLAGVRFLLGEYASAEPAIQRSIQILEAERPPRPTALAKARENYIQLLRRTSRDAEADRMVSLASATIAPVTNNSSAVLPSSHVLDDL